MLKTIFVLLIFGLILISIAVMVVIRFTYKGFNKMRETMEENYYRNQKMKEQKEKNPFGDDYFKSSTGPQQARKRASSQYEQCQSGSSRSSGTSRASGQDKTTTRRTTTSSGITIIDDRDTEEKRKIFDHSDGEYVEFEEV